MTTIAFDLAQNGRVQLRIYDAAGRAVRDLVTTDYTAARRLIVLR